MRQALAVALGTTILLAGCAPATASRDAADAGREPDLVPAGFGTLKQDEFTIELRSGRLLVKLTPLAESVTRLGAPDTHARLHALAARWSEEAARAAFTEQPELFLVSFFSYEPDVTYQPEAVQLLHEGRLLRPAAIFPLKPDWGRQRLAQQDPQSAVYVFDQRFDYELSIVLRYGLEQSDGWQRIVPRLQTERARVLARASSAR
ncbi:MAG: hypothetical protein ACRELD_03790 [Longimicrobiales bacterium]